MSQIVMYSTAYCPYCIRARYLLERKGIKYQDIRVDNQPQLRLEMREMGGGHTVPQIWIGDRYVGGSDELYELEYNKQLDAILKECVESDLADSVD